MYPPSAEIQQQARIAPQSGRKEQQWGNVPPDNQGLTPFLGLEPGVTCRLLPSGVLPRDGGLTRQQHQAAVGVQGVHGRGSPAPGPPYTNGAQAVRAQL